MRCMFVEIADFTRRIVRLGLEEDLRKLEMRLDDDPRAGDVEVGACGLRKVRMSDSTRGQGQRGGARVLYAYYPHRETIYFLWVYTKAEQGKLTAEQKEAFCRWVRTLEAD